MKGASATQYTDRILAGQVRGKVLEIAHAALEKGPKHPLFKITYECLVRNVLPRLQEVSGIDGGNVKIEIVKYGHDPIQVPTEAIPVTTT